MNAPISHPSIVISGSGIWTPENVITNKELVESYNGYAKKFNFEHKAAIESGKMDEKPLSSARFIEKRAKTRFSSNIRSNFGHMSRSTDADPYGWDKLFHQAGRKVFEEVCPIAAAHIAEHLARLGIKPSDVNKYWLHQANIHMNKMVVKALLGDDLSENKTPTILDRYANTASAGSIIAFHLHHKALKKGDIGIICSFGAGYSVGSLVLRKK